MGVGKPLKKLIQQTIAGDISAFERLIYIYHHRLFDHAIYHLKSPEVAKEIIKASWAEFWQKRKSIRPDSFEAFLSKTVSSHIFRHLRKTADNSRLEEALWSDIQKYHAEVEDETISKRRETITHTIQNIILQGQLNPELKIP